MRARPQENQHYPLGQRQSSALAATHLGILPDPQPQTAKRTADAAARTDSSPSSTQQHYRRLYEEQQQAIRLLQEELAFREQQHFSMNAIINNYEEINAQLTAKVQAFPCKSLLTTAEPTDHDWSLAELPPTRGFRSSRVNGSVERK